MNITADNYLDTLFTTDPIVIAANIAELNRIAAVEAADKAVEAIRAAHKIANRCPKCTGTGYLPQFAHRKGGECYTCGGSSIFTRFAA